MADVITIDTMPALYWEVLTLRVKEHNVGRLTDRRETCVVRLMPVSPVAKTKVPLQEHMEVVVVILDGVGPLEEPRQTVHRSSASFHFRAQ